MKYEIEQQRRLRFEGREKTAEPAMTGDADAREDASRSSDESQSSDASVVDCKNSGRAPPLRVRLWTGVRSCVKHTLTPPTISLVVSIIIGVVPVLRDLFVPAESPEKHFSATAPDGNPPLSTIYDAASFVGAASVPLGLIVLGASIATIEVPKPGKGSPASP